MRHIVAIERLKEINKKTKEIETLKDYAEKQEQIIQEALMYAENQDEKEATMLDAEEWYYFNIDFDRFSPKEAVESLVKDYGYDKILDIILSLENKYKN